jgi:D-amino-acid dehydrogenase
MVGVSGALHLQRRGRDVALIDRRAPGEETSYGNAGLIQREAAIPYTFPREFGVVLSYAMNNRRDAVYHLSALPASRRGSSSTGGMRSPNGSNDRCKRLPR